MEQEANKATPAQAFCDSSKVLVLLVASAFLAICLTVASIRELGNFWPALGLHFIFITIVVLSAAICVCSLSGTVDSHNEVFVSWVGFLVFQAFAIGYSLLVLAMKSWLEPLALLAHSDPWLFLVRNTAISLIVSFFLFRYLLLHSRWRQQIKAEASIRLQVLQNHIRPHFLFNSLNTISSLIHDHPDKAEQATLDLSDLLRSGLSEQAYHTLDDELGLIRSYLRIEQLRLDDRIKVDWDLADDLPLDVELPVLLIQPLVENAVVHGIARLRDGGRLLVRGERTRRGRIRFLIENPLPDETDDIGQADGNRMALDNVRQRLALAWEEGARLKTRRESDRFFVEIVLPIDGGRSA